MQGALASEPAGPTAFRDGRFNWIVAAPVLASAQRPEDPCYSVKDPSIVRHDGRWHLFCTIRSQKRTHQIEYLSFEDWAQAGTAPRHILTLTNGYFCAPQVFYFKPERRWYLIYQVADPDRNLLQPAFSTTVELTNPASWTPPVRLFTAHPANVKAWIDFWVICDTARAYLFFTSNNGMMWRSETPIGKFPHGWSEPVVALRGDIFEASHTYRLQGWDQFLTVIEAQAGGRRYYQAYLADQLDGDWRPLAALQERPFASLANVREIAGHWTDSISHGELVRAGSDERMEVDPAKLQFLFQGATDADMSGRKYGEIPWRLGRLEAEGR